MNPITAHKFAYIALLKLSREIRLAREAGMYFPERVRLAHDAAQSEIFAAECARKEELAA